MKKYFFRRSAAVGPFHLFFLSLCSTVHIWHDLDTQSCTFPDTKGVLNFEYVLSPFPGFLSHILFLHCHFLYHITVYLSVNNLRKWCGSLCSIVDEVGQAMASEVPLLPMDAHSPGRRHPLCALTVDVASQAVLYICISICWRNTYLLLQTNICRSIYQLCN